MHLAHTLLVVVLQHNTPKMDSVPSRILFAQHQQPLTSYIRPALDAASLFQSDVWDVGSAAKLESSNRVRTKLRFTQPERWSIFYLLIYNFIRHWHRCVSHPRAHGAASTHSHVCINSTNMYGQMPLPWAQSGHFQA